MENVCRIKVAKSFTTPKFDRYCYNSNRCGHKAFECRSKIDMTSRQ